jgi:hypothetical protein
MVDGVPVTLKTACGFVGSGRGRGCIPSSFVVVCAEG